MNRSLFLIAMIGAAVFADSACARAQNLVFKQSPVRDANTGLTFNDLAGFKFEKATVSVGTGKDDPFRYAVDFLPPHPGRFQVLISDCGTAHVPEGPRSKEIDSQVGIDTFGLQYQRYKGLLDAADSIDHRVVSIGVGPGAPQFRRITSSVEKNHTQLVLDYYFVGYHGYLIAFRAAFPEEQRAAATQDCQRFLAEFARSFGK